MHHDPSLQHSEVRLDEQATESPSRTASPCGWCTTTPTVKSKLKHGILNIKASSFVLSVHCIDAAGNTGNGTFTLPSTDGHDHDQRPRPRRNT
jgi:hypothetical protein